MLPWTRQVVDEQNAYAAAVEQVADRNIAPANTGADPKHGPSSMLPPGGGLAQISHPRVTINTIP